MIMEETNWNDKIQEVFEGFKSDNLASSWYTTTSTSSTIDKVEADEEPFRDAGGDNDLIITTQTTNNMIIKKVFQRISRGDATYQCLCVDVMNTGMRNVKKADAETGHLFKSTFEDIKYIDKDEFVEEHFVDLL